jgi:hypothetical protein
MTANGSWQQPDAAPPQVPQGTGYPQQQSAYAPAPHHTQPDAQVTPPAQQPQPAYAGHPPNAMPPPGTQPHNGYPVAPVQQPDNGHGMPGAAPGYAPGPAGPVGGQAPSVGPVIVFTTLFGLFGAISANNRAKTAAAMGLAGRKYWIAFVGTLAAWFALGVLMIVAIVAIVASSAPAKDSSAKGNVVTSEWIEQSIVANGDFKTSGGEAVQATAATCTAVTVDDKGAGLYRCMIDFADDSRMSYGVSVDADGKWVTDGGN